MRIPSRPFQGTLIRDSLLTGVLLLMSGCGDTDRASTRAAEPPLVKTTTVRAAPSASLGLSGTIHAQVETPMSFQVGGRITTRLVNAGQQVTAGQVLFELDKQDLEQGVRSASAELAAAKASLATASAELTRNQQLLAKKYVSDQAIERSQLARREAQTRLDVAEARHAQASNARGYGNLKSSSDGVLIEVTAEPGQVIAPGQQVATLAQAGDREIEVFFPEGFVPPAHGEATFGEGITVTITLREKAGAVAAHSHTLRARYTIQSTSHALALGTIVQTRFNYEIVGEHRLQLPIGAIDERSQGARVWRFLDGHIAPVPVTVVAIDSETALIKGPLAIGDKVIALGTHMLTNNMAVRELPSREPVR